MKICKLCWGHPGTSEQYHPTVNRWQYMVIWFIVFQVPVETAFHQITPVVLFINSIHWAKLCTVQRCSFMTKFTLVFLTRCGNYLGNQTNEQRIIANNRNNTRRIHTGYYLEYTIGAKPFNCFKLYCLCRAHQKNGRESGDGVPVSMARGSDCVWQRKEQQGCAGTPCTRGSLSQPYVRI